MGSDVDPLMKGNTGDGGRHGEGTLVCREEGGTADEELAEEGAVYVSEGLDVAIAAHDPADCAVDQRRV